MLYESVYHKQIHILNMILIIFHLPTRKIYIESNFDVVCFIYEMVFKCELCFLSMCIVSSITIKKIIQSKQFFGCLKFFSFFSSFLTMLCIKFCILLPNHIQLVNCLGHDEFFLLFCLFISPFISISPLNRSFCLLFSVFC